jgi:transposase
VLSIRGSSPIHLYLRPTDMRKSFQGLSSLVHQYMGRPDDGGYFVFFNRRRTHVKILFFDGDGLVLWYKRLEKGQFIRPHQEGEKVRLDRRELSCLLEGVEPLRMRERYQAKIP